MNWLAQALEWYFFVFVLGLILFPFTRRFLPAFFDQGYAFAKTISILVVTYIMFVGGIFHLLPFTRLSIIIVCFLLAAANFLLLMKELEKETPPPAPSKKGNNSKKTLPFMTTSFIHTFRNTFSFRIFILEEILFLASFFFIILTRGQEPSIHGLEKFMDFGFINSILRSTYFPPLDMWLSADAQNPNGFFINYYYFGHLTGALLIRLTDIQSAVGYNLILATICGQGVILVFSLVTTLATQAYRLLNKGKTPHIFMICIIGIIAAYIVNFGGNLHTIYLFTTGYSMDNNVAPVPFWNILSGYHPETYWYPNATRFIPYTIHEFPSYSYVVADLHGHVFDIPFVLLTLAVLFSFFLSYHLGKKVEVKKIILERPKKKRKSKTMFFSKEQREQVLTYTIHDTRLPYVIALGFLCAIHYMTNAFDGPIYLGLAVIIIFSLLGFTIKTLLYCLTLVATFIITSLPFSLFFKPFSSAIGVNCSPEFLTKIGKIGPFLFEKGNCQSSPVWMLFILWGFFWMAFLLLVCVILLERRRHKNYLVNPIDIFVLILFAYGLFLTIVPEFFYAKDIYPLHFRANTMFKLGYQAFIMMGIGSGYVLYRLKLFHMKAQIPFKIIFLFFFFFIFVYPFYAFTSFYGKLDKPINLNGLDWLNATLSQDREIIKYLNTNVTGQPIILESEGDSYTDHERISANTGLPTVAGWQVHEWLWRGSSEVVGNRIPDIKDIYESTDIALTRSLLKKYHVSYVVISSLERERYPQLNADKFSLLGKKVFESSNGFGALYKLNF